MDSNVGSDKIVMRVTPEMKAKVIANARALGLSMNEYMSQLADAAPVVDQVGTSDHVTWHGTSSYQISCNSSIMRMNARILASCTAQICGVDAPLIDVDDESIAIEVDVFKLTPAMLEESALHATSMYLDRRSGSITHSKSFDEALAAVIDELEEKAEARDWPRLKQAVKLCINDAAANMRRGSAVSNDEM